MVDQETSSTSAKDSPPSLKRTFRYRLQPSKSQRTKLLHTLDLCRWVYNETLASRKNAWEREKKSLSLFDTNKLLPLWKRDHPELRGVYSQVLQNVQERVDGAFQAFYCRVKARQTPGYPRFRGPGRYDSFTYKQFGFQLQGKELSLPKIGPVKILLHRPLEGKIKTLTIQRDRLGNWYACFVCEVDPKPLPFTDRVVGVDVGLESFATLSTGTKIINPRFFRRDEQALSKAQRKLSKAKKGTPERAKRRRAVQHIHQGIAHRRRDFTHQVSRELVNHYGRIIFERLNTQGMLQNHTLAKSIADAAWSQLITNTCYKAEKAGRVVVLVNPRNTSQRCSGCGEMVEKPLSVRVHCCPICGLVMDRDHNAAINILGLGLQSLCSALKAPTIRRGD